MIPETNFFEMLQDEEVVSKWWKSLLDDEVLKLAGHPDPDRNFSELAIFTQIKIYHVWKSQDKHKIGRDESG